MKNDDLRQLTDEINSIQLNHEDLMQCVLDFIPIYNKDHPKDSASLDAMLGHGHFINQAVLSAREGLVLAMHAVMLDPAIDFKDIIEHCVDLENQRYNEEEVCADDHAKELMQDFNASLRKEVFSRVMSQNKALNRATKIPKSLLQFRHDIFMSNEF